MQRRTVTKTSQSRKISSPLSPRAVPVVDARRKPSRLTPSPAHRGSPSHTWLCTAAGGRIARLWGLITIVDREIMATHAKLEYNCVREMFYLLLVIPKSGRQRGRGGGGGQPHACPARPAAPSPGSVSPGRALSQQGSGRAKGGCSHHGRDRCGMPPGQPDRSSGGSTLLLEGLHESVAAAVPPHAPRNSTTTGPDTSQPC